ncbi:hypothetical protein ACIRPK_22350 [Kitasatospora sp. NPDC101801]|uniref:hypothetical protein n=1 Tax=Kitasatospora sp. NPDC101801 TaxID=3364103 RepID=UPI003828B556
MSGRLTGPFGILGELLSGPVGEELRAYVAADLAPVVRFVREGPSGVVAESRSAALV